MQIEILDDVLIGIRIAVAHAVEIHPPRDLGGIYADVRLLDVVGVHDLGDGVNGIHALHQLRHDIDEQQDVVVDGGKQGLVEDDIPHVDLPAEREVRAERQTHAAQQVGEHPGDGAEIGVRHIRRPPGFFQPVDLLLKIVVFLLFQPVRLGHDQHFHDSGELAGDLLAVLAQRAEILAHLLVEEHRERHVDGDHDQEKHRHDATVIERNPDGDQHAENRRQKVVLNVGNQSVHALHVAQKF